MDSSNSLAVEPGGPELTADLTDTARPGRLVVHLAAGLRNRDRWTEDFGDVAARRLADLHDRIARSLMKKHNGRRVGPIGEYQMLFYEPDDALDFALAYFRALDKLSEGAAAEIVSGVGIHRGKNRARDREIALKLAASAGSRRILLTQEAFDSARSRLEASRTLAWQPRSSCESAGVAGPLGVVEIRFPDPEPDGLTP